MAQSQGKLLASTGMTLDEVRQKSTLKLGEGYYSGVDAGGYSGPRDTTISSSEVLFDFELAGSPKLQFKNCKYYQLRTGTDDDPKLIEINIGIAEQKMRWAELVKSMQQIEQLLIDEGWKPARYKDGTTASESLNKILKADAPAQLNAGFTWSKGDVALTLSAKRMRKAEKDEDTAAKVDFINFLKLETRAAWERSSNPFGHALL
jgi:hypothetical protein